MKRRRIVAAEVQRLALCRKGKNRMKTLYKADGTAEWRTLSKTTEQGQLLTVMWPKGLADVDGDFADTDEAIASMTASLISNGGELDLEHDGKVLPKEAAYITEVFTIQKSDPRFHGWEDYDGSVQDVTGGCAVQIQIDDVNLRKACREGVIDGVSLFGPAAVEEVDLKAASQRVAARMGGVQEIEMTKEELQAALAKQNEDITNLVKSIVADAIGDKPDPNTKKTSTTDEPKDKELVAPTFTGDPSKPEDLEAYENALRSFEIQKSIASGKLTADDVAKMAKSLRDGSDKGPSVDELTAAGIKASDEDSPEVRELQHKLFKSMKGSNAPKDVEKPSAEEVLAKANADEAKLLADLLNQEIGGAQGASGMKIVSK